MNPRYLVMVECFDDLKCDYSQHFFTDIDYADAFWVWYHSTHSECRTFKYVLPLDKFRKKKFQEVRCLPVADNWRPRKVDDD